MEKTGSLSERAARLAEIAVEVRSHIIDMIYTAGSGHPGSSLSAADIMTALYFDLARVDPARPQWPDRDRIVLSKGHGCPVWYACLALRGYFPLSALKTLRRFESILQGHPDMNKTPGVDMTTGSLGHGLSLGVGMALEGKLRRADYTVYVILGDGEVQEGQVWEAAASAAKYGLDNLVAVVDRNRLQMDGFTDQVMPMEPLAAKFEAFNWQVLGMDGHDMEAILATLQAARDVKNSPVCVLADTVKGKGVSFMENVRVWHGKCPDKKEYEQAMREIRGGRPWN
jgi:transketolase